MKIEWLGHSSFSIDLGGTTFVTDPGYEHDPNAPVTGSEVDYADFVLVGHGHFDHVSDAVAVAKASDATIVGVPELVTQLAKQGDVNTVMRNPSPPLEMKNGVKVGLIRMDHSNSMGLMEDDISYAGINCGFILESANKKVFFAGDTGICANLKIVGEVYNPDVALLPISGGSVMNADEAGLAAHWTKANIAIPMHYDSLDVLPDVDPKDFTAAVDDYGSQCKSMILTRGESKTI